MAIFNLMEDAATAEISRSQVWQWCNHPDGMLDDGRKITTEIVKSMVPEEIAKIREAYGDAYDEEKRTRQRSCFLLWSRKKNLRNF